MIKLEWFAKAEKDYRILDGNQKIQIDKGLDKIQSQGMLAGKILSGNLAGCREIKNKRLGLRIIFKEGSSTEKIEIIQIIAIGKRHEKEVFKEANKRIQKNQ